MGAVDVGVWAEEGVEEQSHWIVGAPFQTFAQQLQVLASGETAKLVTRIKVQHLEIEQHFRVWMDGWMVDGYNIIHVIEQFISRVGCS